MENNDNMEDIMKSNIIRCIIKCFLNIKELNNIFQSMNQINNLSSIAIQYYHLIKNYNNNNNNNMNNLESAIKNEISKKQIIQNSDKKNNTFEKQNGQNNDKKNNPFENIIETFISSINFENLFNIEKQIFQKCQKCEFKTKNKTFITHYSSFVLNQRVYHGKVFLNKLLEPNKICFNCNKCKEKDILLSINEFIFVPQIYIIILKDNINKYKIIYPKKDLNIGCFINNEKGKQNISYKLKSLIIEKEKNIFETYIFSNDNDYSKCDNDDKFHYPIILFYQRHKIPLLDNRDNNNREDSFNEIIKKNQRENNNALNENNSNKSENHMNIFTNNNYQNNNQNNKIFNNSGNNNFNNNLNNAKNNNNNNFNPISNNFNQMNNNNLNPMSNNFNPMTNNFNQMNINLNQKNNNNLNPMSNNFNQMNNNPNINNKGNFTNFPNNNLMNGNFNNNNINFYNNNNNFNNYNNYNNNQGSNNNINNNNNNNNNSYNNSNNNNNNMNNINNNNNNNSNSMNPYNNNNNNINNNYNMNNNNINTNNNNQNLLNENKNITENNKNKIICLYFKFNKYNKEIYIDINEDYLFSKVIDELKKKYLWFSSVKNPKFIFNRQILDDNITVRQNELQDSSTITICFDENEN